MNDENHANEKHPVTTPQFAVAGQPSYARTLFFDVQGLRPGWGFAFYVVSFVVLQQIAVQLAWMHDFRDSGLWSMLLEEVGDLIAAIVPAIILMRIEHRRWGAYGLPGKGGFGSRFWLGMLWGFAGISLLMLLLYGLRAFSLGHVILHGQRLFRFAGFWAAYFLLVGLFEEFLLRGYTQFTLARGIGFWRAAIALSCLFGLIHLRNEGEQWRGILAAIALGFFFCFSLQRTGTLWFAVGFHAAWDWGETFFYSVPDSGMVAPGHLLSSKLHGSPWLSGGTVGPEGSVVCFLVVGVIWFAFDRLHPHKPAALPTGQS